MRVRNRKRRCVIVTMTSWKCSAPEGKPSSLLFCFLFVAASFTRAQTHSLTHISIDRMGSRGEKQREPSGLSLAVQRAWYWASGVWPWAETRSLVRGCRAVVLAQVSWRCSPRHVHVQAENVFYWTWIPVVVYLGWQTMRQPRAVWHLLLPDLAPPPPPE